MKINNVSLPYPVLGNSDDVTKPLPNDCVQLNYVIGKDDYSFELPLVMNNDDIDDLIKEGKAEYTCEVTCPRTYLRQCYHSAEPHFNIKLNRKNVFGRIEFSCYVTVSKPINDYFNSDQNEDYGEATFDLEPGDVLAVFPTLSYNADLQYEKMYAAGSFMVVLDGGDNAKKVWFDANDDQIKVYLPTALYKQFRLLCNDRNFNELFHASIVFNALFKVLSDYRENVYGKYMWADAIKYRINNEKELENFSIDDTSKAYELAEALLKDPYKRMFNHLYEQQNKD